MAASSSGDSDFVDCCDFDSIVSASEVFDVVDVDDDSDDYHEGENKAGNETRGLNATTCVD